MGGGVRGGGWWVELGEEGGGERELGQYLVLVPGLPHSVPVLINYV